MLTHIKTNLDLPALRLQDIVVQIPNGHLNIFPIGSWREPWGFGKNNAKEAKDIYKEAAVALGVADEWDFEREWSLDDEDEDIVIISFKEGDKIGIVSICPDRYEAYEDLEGIVDYLIKQKTILPTAAKSTDNKSTDNTFDIPKMSLFK